MRVRPRYTPEFRADALKALEQGDRSLPMVARGLGVSITTLRNWYLSAEMAKKRPKKPAGAAPASQGDAAERESAKDQIRRLERELAAARREIDTLKTDREILKKAAAFFAKESE